MIKGYRTDLSNERCVFVGERNGDPYIYIEFNNGGDHTHIKLSREAASALQQLLNFDGYGTPTTKLRFMLVDMTWEKMEKEDGK